MKFIDSVGPNPRCVRMFMLEKDIELPSEQVDLMAADNRKPPYTDRNPGGQMPALALDDGTTIAETVAICEYLEELHPTPTLIGATPEQRAETRMWQRRVELNITEHMYNGFRYAEGLELFKDRVRCLPEAAAGLKTIAREKLAWLDGLMAGKNYICGDRLALPDMILFCCMDFCAGVGQVHEVSLKNIDAWFKRMSARPSAEKSLHPGGAGSGMRGL